MKPWPSLEPFGKALPMPEGDLFYYDSARDTDSVKGNDSNSGKPALVLIHGLGDEADTWRHVFPLLANAGYRVIAPDLPGFGRSAWKGRISVHRQCRAVIRLLTETGAASTENPAVFAGSSLGAGIAEITAIKRPDLAKALILIGGCVPVSGGMDKGIILMGMPFAGKAWYRAFRKNHEGAWKSLYPYYGDLDAMSAEDRDFLRTRVIARVESSSQERGYFATLRSIGNVFLFEQKSISRKVKLFSGKVLLMWGEQDRIMPQKSAALFRDLRPDAELKVISGAGHLPHQEKPAESAAEMLRFLVDG
jgi:pimeloyl-ACP methyl ester carboxylesterase